MSAGQYIGVMSGTSLDGIDIVLAMIDQQNVTQRISYSYAIPTEIKQAVLSINQGQKTTLEQVGRLDYQLGTLYGQAINQMLQENGMLAEHITAIGCHGQTVWHQPTGDAPFTMQLGDNNRIAALTGITTIGDFRRRDMAYGGQGAPLVPAFHQILLAHPDERRMVLNIGGIANLSLLLPDEPVRGFDTGPGNILMDAWIAKQLGQPYDKDAEWGRTGRIHHKLLQNMLAEPYFAQLMPKSSGRELFNLAWLEHHLSQLPAIAPQDVQSTLIELTAQSVTDQVKLFGGCQRLLVCGGGANNPLVMARMAELLPYTQICVTDDFGVSGGDMEALAFAWLAYRTYSGLSGNLPSVTGATQATILGAIYPANPCG